MKFKKPFILILLLCLISVTATFLFTACGKIHISFKDPPTNNSPDNPPNDNPNGGSGDNTGDEVDDHKHSFVKVITPATCTEQGYTTYTCECGESNIYDYTQALGHNMQHYNAKAATCTEFGWNAYDACSRCDYSTYNEIKALGHNLQHYSAQAATCTGNGWEAYEACTRGDYTTYKEVKALGHDICHYSAKAATCTEVGWNAYDKCTRGDYTTYKEIKALGHDIRHYSGKAATCTESGWNAYDICSRGDYSTYKEIAAHGHKFESSKCVYCGESDGSHTHSYKVTVIQPTCTERGYTTYECSGCDYKYADKYVNALGHDLKYYKAQAATCTEAGWEAYAICSRGDFNSYKEIAALGHNFVETFFDKTCTKSAYVTRNCDKCEVKETKPISDISAKIERSVGDSQNGNIYEFTLTVNAEGGFGQLQYKYEIFASQTSIAPTEIKDFSISNSLNFASNDSSALNEYVVRITAKDEYGNFWICRYLVGDSTQGDILSTEVNAGKHNFVGDYCSWCYKSKYSEGLSYQKGILGDNSYTVVGIGDCTDRDIVIPSIYNNLPVTAIAEKAFANCLSLTSVIIPNSVTTIGLGAFEGCTSLESVTIPFVGASKGSANNHIGYIFGASDVGTIDGGLYNSGKVPPSLKAVTITGGTTIGDYAFHGCISLENLIIPDSVTSIGEMAISGCSSLKHVIIGRRVTSIGNKAFYKCTSLTNITLPDSVTSIDGWAFDSCSGLKSIVIPNSITSIGNSAFKSCTGLETVYYGGTDAQWRKIDIATLNSSLTNATRYYYSQEYPYVGNVTSGNFWHYVNGEIVIWVKEN